MHWCTLGVLLLASAVNATLCIEDDGILDALRRLSSLPLDILLQGNVSSQCQREMQFMIQEAGRGQLWALKILDANAKLPSGLLNGNTHQFGDFDLCLSAQETTREGVIKGRYCLADIDFTLREQYKPLDDLMHGYRSMTSNLSDPGQRLPKLSSIRWGVCIPASCQAEDVSTHMKNILSRSLYGVANVDLRVDHDLCYTSDRPDFTWGHFIAITILTLWASCVLLGTIIPPSSREFSTMRSTLSCFSLLDNWTALTKTTPDRDDIAIVHGARALNAIALLLSHKQMAQLFNPFVNSAAIGETMSGTWSMIGRAAILYTDSFILISGLLTAYAMVKELDRDKKLHPRRNIISRYIRFTPNLFFIILVCTFMMDFLGPGPQWGLVVSKYSDLCKINMWRNFLYIHNYFGFEDMCLTHTHQLGIDMQLFLISPILVYILWKNTRIGVFVLTIIAAASTWLRYSITLEKQLSTVIYYGVSVDRLFKTARYSYILPTHRATVYCMGLLLGYGARRGLSQLNISKTKAWLGWSLATGMAVVAMFGPAHMAQRGYIYNAMDAAVYNALAPILWCLFLVWSAVAGWNNMGGWFYNFLTWKYFIVFSRISYAFYLVQFPIFFYNVGIQRTSQFYSGFFSIVDIKEFSAIFALSTLFTLTVDMPCQNLKKLWVAPRNFSKKEIPEVNSLRNMNHG